MDKSLKQQERRIEVLKAVGPVDLEKMNNCSKGSRVCPGFILLLYGRTSVLVMGPGGTREEGSVQQGLKASGRLSDARGVTAWGWQNGDRSTLESLRHRIREDAALRGLGSGGGGGNRHTTINRSSAPATMDLCREIWLAERCIPPAGGKLNFFTGSSSPTKLQPRADNGRVLGANYVSIYQ